VATRTKKLSEPLPLGLALIAGTGFIVMTGAIAVGAQEGAAANTGTISVAFGLGLTLFLFGLGAWLAAVRPWEHFDDINVPAVDDHHGHTAHDAHAITVAPESSVEAHAETHAASHS
jgi:hypothetical protein